MEHFNNPWLREGATVYQLMHHGWRKGVETFRNAFSFHVQADDGSGYNGKELATRIVACVNACAGLDQFALDGGWTAMGMSAYAKKLEQQRDELLCELSKHQRYAAIGRAVERASEALPEGFDLHIELEKDAGTVRLYYPDGEESTDEFHEGDHFANYIDNAINVAIANAKGA